LKRDFRPVPLGVEFSMKIENTVQTKESANVIGKFSGSDARLAREAVIYTAHHDHLGMKTDPKPGEDAIYNGALDNASGVSSILVALATMEGRVVKPDQFPDRGFFYRSDQFNLAKIGVPAAYFHSGTEIIGKPNGWGKKRIEEWEEKDYHQPSDELRSDWDLS